MTGEKFSDMSKRIKKAIREINKGLDEKLWLDGFPGPRQGKKIFDRERHAVKELMQLLKDVTGQGVPEIASSFTDPTGQYTSFGANDMTGRWAGVPIVDATLRRYSMNLPLVSL